MSLAGKSAIITGAGQGIGRAIALTLARAGADVTLVARTQGAIDTVADECRALGVRALPVAGDVADEGDVRNVVARTMREFGRVDILVNNAGIVIPAPVVDIKTEDWDRVIGVNLSGPFYFMKHACREMISAGRGGKVVNISSTAAEDHFPGFGSYSASKAGLVGLGMVVSEEMKAHNINVNTINVGLTDTPAVRKRLAVDPAELLRPENIADVVRFLVSDEAVGMVGAVVNVVGRRH